tara:strand:- start:816 stop:1013 length:198 start_codon:yes stop_codon:yes gene_type:complete
MYKPVNTNDIFKAADGNRDKPLMQPTSVSAPLVNATTEPKKDYNAMTDAEAIRSMGDRLSKIWED